MLTAAVYATPGSVVSQVTSSRTQAGQYSLYLTQRLLMLSHSYWPFRFFVHPTARFGNVKINQTWLETVTSSDQSRVTVPGLLPKLGKITNDVSAEARLDSMSTRTAPRW